MSLQQEICYTVNNASISTNATCYSSPPDPLYELSSVGWILAGWCSVAHRDHQAVSASCPALSDEPAKELQEETKSRLCSTEQCCHSRGIIEQPKPSEPLSKCNQHQNMPTTAISHQIRVVMFNPKTNPNPRYWLTTQSKCLSSSAVCWAFISWLDSCWMTFSRSLWSSSSLCKPSSSSWWACRTEVKKYYCIRL